MLRSLLRRFLPPFTAAEDEEDNAPLLPPARILVVADLHLFFRDEMIQLKQNAHKYDYDCVLLLGDIMKDELREFVRMADGRPCLSVLGNHDVWGQNEGIEGLTNLDGKTVTVNGIRISGAGGGPRYKGGDWAMRTEEEMEEVLRGIEKTDILATHDSPFHLMQTNRSHSGFQAISDFIEKEKPAIHVFGHHHEQCIKKIGGTAELCVYQCALLQTNPLMVRRIF